MKVLSFTQTLVTNAGAAHFKSAAKSTPELDAALIYFPPGTVIEMGDEEARDRIEQGLVAEWLPEVHGETPASIANRMSQTPPNASDNPPSSVRNG